MNRCRSCDGLFKPSIPTQTSQHSALQKTSKWHGTLLSFSVFVPGVALDSSNTLKRPTSRRSTSIFGGHQSVRRQVRVFVENTWLRVLVHVTLRRRSGGMRDGSIHGGLPAIPRLLLLLLLRWQQRKKGKLPHVRGGAVRTIVAVSSSPGYTDLTLSRTSSSRAQQIETLRVVLSVGAGSEDRGEDWERWEGRRERAGLLSLLHTVDFTQSLTEWLTWLTHYPRAEPNIEPPTWDSSSQSVQEERLPHRVFTVSPRLFVPR